MKKRIFLTRTEGEWASIKKKVKTYGKSSFTAHLRCEIHKLKLQFEECSECITPAEGEMIKKEYSIPEDIAPMLTFLSVKMKKPISTIVDEFVIMPLLSPNFSAPQD